MDSLATERIDAMDGLKPLRGEIWMFDLDPKKGREQKGVRPCLVVSTDALNQSGFAGVVHDTGSAPQAIEQIETTKLDCVYIGDSTARTHLFSVLLALNRVGYRGRIVIVAYGLELTAPHGAGVTIDLRAIARLTPEQFAEDCRQQ